MEAYLACKRKRWMRRKIIDFEVFVRINQCSVYCLSFVDATESHELHKTHVVSSTRCGRQTVKHKIRNVYEIEHKLSIVLWEDGRRSKIGVCGHIMSTCPWPVLSMISLKQVHKWNVYWTAKTVSNLISSEQLCVDLLRESFIVDPMTKKLAQRRIAMKINFNLSLINKLTSANIWKCVTTNANLALTHRKQTMCRINRRW